MKIWMVAAEIAPFIKVGGLGDVLGSLPQALSELGCEVTVVAPYVPSLIKRKDLEIKPTGVSLEISFGIISGVAHMLEARRGPGVRVLFVDYPPYFGRDGLYGEPQGDYVDNDRRFAFFSHAAIQAMKRFDPDARIVHCHDWQSGLVPFLLKTPAPEDKEWAEKLRIVHTIHNLAHQGVFHRNILNDFGMPWNCYNYKLLEFYDNVNYLKAGLAAADALTTVSPTYAAEIQTPAQGYGLEGLLSERSADLHGILNGIDIKSWNPDTDPHLAQKYSAAALAKKKKNRETLQREFGFKSNGRPVVGIVNRLVNQKGIDLIVGLADQMENLGLQWVLLGAGDAPFEAASLDLAAKHPKTFAARIGFDEELAHMIYAGSDLFCMPSLFEPCGLGQMIALRYGTLPVVRRTGGLADTVEEIEGNKGDGFLFDDFSSNALAQALGKATSFAKHPRKLSAARKRAMTKDFSWKSSARRYLDLYKSLLLTPKPREIDSLKSPA